MSKAQEMRKWPYQGVIHSSVELEILSGKKEEVEVLGNGEKRPGG